jgi:hypothetical protein
MTTRYVQAGFALALCLHFLAAADSAKAEDVDVTDVVGGACVPDSATVRAGLYETAGFGVHFGSGTGRIPTTTAPSTGTNSSAACEKGSCACRRELIGEIV